MSTTTLLLPHIFIVHLLIVMMTVSAQQPQKASNITLGSTLTTSQNPKWISPNEAFAFGFYPVTPTHYLVGVWFDSISDKTLIWTPRTDNADIPVEKGSTLQLSASGLELLDSNRKSVWSVSVIVSSAALQNSGNFMLLNEAFQTVWQSFDSPTDTLLPGQTLKWKSIMYSKASDINYSSGKFMLNLQEDGNLVSYPMDQVTPSASIWNTGTFKLGALNPSNLIFNWNGELSLVNSTNATVARIGKAGQEQFFRRLTLDTDGILKEYVWNNSGSWSPEWQDVDDPCKIWGQCGLNGICRLTGQATADCVCLPGFDFIDNDDHFKGCDQNSSSTCSAKPIFTELNNIDWPQEGSYSVKLINESECKQICLDDCNCIVAVYDSGRCWKKQVPIVGRRQAADASSKAFVKVFDAVPFNKSEGEPMRKDKGKTPQIGESKSKDKGKTPLMIAVSLGGCFSTLLVVICVYYACNFRTRAKIGEAKDQYGLKAFSYKEIHAATGGFKQELGRGASGKVYKGVLSDGREIAVKSLDKLVQEDQSEKEFRTEVSVIGTNHHKNLVQLYGFCDEGSHRLLVYEYMPNGSLDGVLFAGRGFLDWKSRVRIVIEIARGILYLHEECTAQIIHCDIKPQNILLDEHFKAKIADFGLAKLMKAEQTRTFTGARGTRGYIAPDWHRNMAITVKVDVYSFGVMLLEIVCCRKTLKLDAPENEMLLFDWVYQCMQEGKLVNLVEQQLSGDDENIDKNQLERMVLVGLWCIQEDPCLRPSMKKAVYMLEGTVEVAVPPPQIFY